MIRQRRDEKMNRRGVRPLAAILLALGPLASGEPLSAVPPVVTEILGRPTDRSVTVNARSDAALELYYEYGPASGSAAARTATVTAAALSPTELLLEGLAPDARTWYRMRYRAAGSTGPFETGSEHSLHTQRAPGSSFTFALQGDSHPERASQFAAALYERTLATVAADAPDFYLTMGDDFSIDTLRTLTAEAVAERYTIQLPWLGIVAPSAPLFLVNGNHEQAARYLLDGTPNNPAVWAQNARNRFYPQPAPDTFYSGNTEEVPYIGLLRNTFAFTWGDALFVVLDPYWSSPVVVDGPLDANAPKTTDKWEITHGDAQYSWLKKTLEASHARWKFVFAHHVGGTGRGGIESAREYEWGGNNQNGTWGFAAHRPSWPMPIHQLMAANGVTIFFQGHDHLFCRQELDGVVYQELPEPADPSYTLWNGDAYTSGDKLANTGYTRVNVSPSGVRVEYVKTWLPKDETGTRRNGEVAFSYTVGEAGPLPPAATWLLPSSARAPGDGGAFYTTDLTIANTGTAVATIGLTFLGHDADGRDGAEKSLTLGGGECATLDDVLGSTFGLESGYGAIRIASSTAALAVSSETWTAASGVGTFGQSVPAFGDGDLVRPGSPRTILGVRQDASFRTNLVLANATEAALDVDVSLVAESGATLGSRRYPLLPLGMTQVPRVARELGVTSDVAGARLVLSTPTVGGAFAAYAALIDAFTNDPRTLLPR